MAESRQVAQGGQDYRVHRHRQRQPFVVLLVQRQALLGQLLPPGQISIGCEGGAGLDQRHCLLVGRHVLAAGHEVVAQAGILWGVAAQPPEPSGRRV